MTANVRIIRELGIGRKVIVRKLKPRIKIIEKETEPTFTERLEAKARRLIDISGIAGHADFPEAILRSEIALTMSQINSVRSLHANLRRKLLRVEVYIDNELIQRTPRPPVYDDPRQPERDMLRARLMKIDAERRKNAISEEGSLRELHSRLWSLLQKHSHVRTHRETSIPADL